MVPAKALDNAASAAATANAVVAELTRLIAYAACQGCGETLHDPHRIACCPHTVCGSCADTARSTTAHCPVRGCGLSIRPADLALDTDTKTIVDSILALERHANHNSHAQIRYTALDENRGHSHYQRERDSSTNDQQNTQNCPNGLTRPTIDWFYDQATRPNAVPANALPNPPQPSLSCTSPSKQQQNPCPSISTPIIAVNAKLSTPIPIPDDAAIPATPSQESVDSHIQIDPAQDKFETSSRACSVATNLPQVIPSSVPQSPVNGQSPTNRALSPLHSLHAFKFSEASMATLHSDRDETRSKCDDISSYDNVGKQPSGLLTRPRGNAEISKNSSGPSFSLNNIDIGANCHDSFLDQKMVVYLSKIPSPERKQCESICRSFALEYVKTLASPQTPTMVVTPLHESNDGSHTGSVKDISFGVLHGLVRRIPVVSPQWLLQSDEKGMLLPVESFLSSSHSSRPNVQVFLRVCAAFDPGYEESIKSDIARLIIDGGGVVVESVDNLMRLEKSCSLKIIVVPDNVALPSIEMPSSSAADDIEENPKRVDFSWISDCIMSGKCPPSSQHFYESCDVQSDPSSID